MEVDRYPIFETCYSEADGKVTLVERRTACVLDDGSNGRPSTYPPAGKGSAGLLKDPDFCIGLKATNFLVAEEIDDAEQRLKNPQVKVENGSGGERKAAEDDAVTLARRKQLETKRKEFGMRKALVAAYVKWESLARLRAELPKHLPFPGGAPLPVTAEPLDLLGVSRVLGLRALHERLSAMVLAARGEIMTLDYDMIACGFVPLNALTLEPEDKKRKKRKC